MAFSVRHAIAGVLFNMAETTDNTSMLSDYSLEIHLENCSERYMKNVGGINVLELYSLANSCW